jgi:hypothetical protein
MLCTRPRRPCALLPAGSNRSIFHLHVSLINRFGNKLEVALFLFYIFAPLLDNIPFRTLISDSPSFLSPGQSSLIASPSRRRRWMMLP